MACLKYLRTDYKSDADTGGTWTFVGYNNVSETAPFTSGATINSISYNPGDDFTSEGEDPDNPELTTDTLVAGFYKFEYTVGSVGCNDISDLILEVNDICYPTPGTDAQGNLLPVFTANICYNLDTLQVASYDIPANINAATACNVDFTNAVFTQVSGQTYDIVGPDYIIYSADLYIALNFPGVGVYNLNYDINFNDDNTETYSSCTSCSARFNLVFEVTQNIALLDPTYGTYDNPVIAGDALGGSTAVDNEFLDWDDILNFVTDYTFFGEGPDILTPEVDIVQSIPSGTVINIGTSLAQTEVLCVPVAFGDRLRSSVDGSPCQSLGADLIRLNELPPGKYAFHACTSSNPLSSCTDCQTFYVLASCSDVTGGLTIVPETTGSIVTSLSYTGVNCSGPQTVTWTLPNGSTQSGSTLDLVDGSNLPANGVGIYSLTVECDSCETTVSYTYCVDAMYVISNDFVNNTATLIEQGNILVSGYGAQIVWTKPDGTQVTQLLSSNGTVNPLPIDQCGSYSVQITAGYDDGGNQVAVCSQTINFDRCDLSAELSFNGTTSELTGSVTCDNDPLQSEYICNDPTEIDNWTLHNGNGQTSLNALSNGRVLDLDLVSDNDGVYEFDYQCGNCAASDVYLNCIDSHTVSVSQNGCQLIVSISGLNNLNENQYTVVLTNTTQSNTLIQSNTYNGISAAVIDRFIDISTYLGNGTIANGDTITASVFLTYNYDGGGGNIIPYTCSSITDTVVIIDSCTGFEFTSFVATSNSVSGSLNNPLGLPVTYFDWHYHQTNANLTTPCTTDSCSVNTSSISPSYGIYSGKAQISDTCFACSTQAYDVICPSAPDVNVVIMYSSGIGEVDVELDSDVRSLLTSVDYNIVTLTVVDTNQSFSYVNVISNSFFPYQALDPYTGNVEPGLPIPDNFVGNIEVTISEATVTYNTSTAKYDDITEVCSLGINIKGNFYNEVVRTGENGLNGNQGVSFNQIGPNSIYVRIPKGIAYDETNTLRLGELTYIVAITNTTTGLTDNYSYTLSSLPYVDAGSTLVFELPSQIINDGSGNTFSYSANITFQYPSINNPGTTLTAGPIIVTGGPIS